MVLRVTKYDPAEDLGNSHDQAELIAEAFETGDPAFIKAALNTVARAQNMSQIAEKAGISRQALYKALSQDGDPKLSTLLGVIKAMGIQISANVQVPSGHP